MGRPAFEDLQAALFAGGIGKVVVWKLYRLSRSLLDGINGLADWCDKALRVVSVTEQIDLNGVLGKMIANFPFGFAEMEQDNRRERQSADIAAAKERDVCIGRKAGSTKGKPRQAKRLQEKFMSQAEIATAMAVGQATVCRFLKA